MAAVAAFMTAAAPYLEAASAAVSIVSAVAGTGEQVAGAQRQAQAAQQAANFNAQVEQQNAAIVQAQTAQQVEQQHRAAVLKIGAMRALYGASGVSMAGGSPLDVLASSAAQAKLDEQTLRYNGEVKALNYTNQATLDTMSGNEAAAEGSSRASAALMSGAASTLSTISDVAPSISHAYNTLFPGPTTVDLMPTDI